MTSLEKYLAAGRVAGCPRAQMDNFVRAGVILQRRQLVASAAARLCDRPGGPTAVGYGGARGGGKSHWLLAQMGADDCQRVPGLKCLLLRKVGKANVENFEDLRRRLFGGLSHEFSAYRGVLTFRNGSRIIAGHFQAEKDIDAYLGLEYDVIGIEEATTLSSRKHQDISTCCRTSKASWRPRIYSTTNPGGVGHAWYRQKFIVPFQERREMETRFIPARVTDNRYCNPEYVKVLSNLSGWQKRAWFDGEWDIAAGQFFTTFRREVHVIEDFDDTRAREWFCALDYGFTHYTVALLGCTDGDGNVFVVDEHAERLWLPQRHAQSIKAMLARHKIGAGDDRRPLTLPDLKRFVAGADVFSRQNLAYSLFIPASLGASTSSKTRLKALDGIPLATLEGEGSFRNEREEAAVAGKGVNDGGIDGLINEDRLGLDRLYVQAKRWQSTVGRPEIQNFVGALAGQHAHKGIFITTSEFSTGALEYVRNLPQRVILIDGHRLAELMIEHNIGVSRAYAYEIKRIDSDYFEES